VAIKCHQWRWPLPWPLLAWRRGSGGGEEEGGDGRFGEASGRGREGAPMSALAGRRAVAEAEASAASGATATHPSAPARLSTRIFCILTLLLKNIYVWIPRNFICNFGPDARRHRLWRRGNTARRHSLWRRGMTWQQRLPAPRADLASMWRRRGLIARRHRSWRRATEAYKTAALLAESSTIPLISKLHQIYLDSKIRGGLLHRLRYGAQLICFVYWVVSFIVAHSFIV
jgi:hypothetical protein